MLEALQRVLDFLRSLQISGRLLSAFKQQDPTAKAIVVHSSGTYTYTLHQASHRQLICKARTGALTLTQVAVLVLLDTERFMSQITRHSGRIVVV